MNKMLDLIRLTALILMSFLFALNEEWAACIMVLVLLEVIEIRRDMDYVKYIFEQAAVNVDLDD